MRKTNMCVMSRENFSIEDLVEELKNSDWDPPKTHGGAEGGSELGCSQLSSLIRSNEDLLSLGGGGNVDDNDNSTDLVSSGALFSQLTHKITALELIISSLQMFNRLGATPSKSPALLPTNTPPTPTTYTSPASGASLSNSLATT